MAQPVVALLRRAVLARLLPLLPVLLPARLDVADQGGPVGQ